MRSIGFQVTRYGLPISQVALRDGIDTGIQYSQYFETYEALVAAGLDLWRYERGDYDTKFLARVVAWHRAHKMVRQHSEQAVTQHLKRKAKRRR